MDASLSKGQGTISFLWSTAEVSNKITVNSGALYSVKVTDSDNGCSPTAQFNVVENNSSPNTGSITGNTSPVCKSTGESYSVNANATSKFHWTVPGSAIIITDTTGLGVNAISVEF